MNVQTGTTNAILTQLTLTEKIVQRHLLHHNWNGVSVAALYCARLDAELRRRHDVMKQAHGPLSRCPLCMHERLLRMLRNLDKEYVPPSPANKKTTKQRVRPTPPPLKRQA
jgi:hypothetical protein